MRENGYKHDLLIFGSSANGLALRDHSDLDLSVIIHNLPELTDGKDKAELNQKILLQIIETIDSDLEYSERFSSNKDNIISASFGY